MDKATAGVELVGKVLEQTLSLVDTLDDACAHSEHTFVPKARRSKVRE